MLSKKVKQAITLLRLIPNEKPIELCFSGGKDSSVILHLAKMSGINYETIYKNTTIDPPGTISFCKKNGAKIINPSIPFFEIVKKRGYPMRTNRFCCKILKEYKVLDNSILGIRTNESISRKKRYKENSACKIYSKNEKVQQFYPILNWTNEDVKNFIIYEKIDVHPLYFDELGNFDVNKRLGCIGCPFNYNRNKELKKYPKFVKSLIKSADIWMNTPVENPRKIGKKIDNCYDLFFALYFCKDFNDFFFKKYNLFGRIDTKNLIEEYFNIDLTL